MHVEIFGTLRDLVGTRRIEVPLEQAGTLRSMLRAATGQFPALASELWTPDGDLTGYIKIVVNGRDLAVLRDRGLDTPLSADDRVALFPRASSENNWQRWF